MRSLLRPSPASPRRPRAVTRLPRFVGALLVLMLAAIASPVAAASPQTPPSAGARGDASSPPSDAPWVWPVAGARTIVDPFRAPEHRYGSGHRGMDVAAAGAIVAPARGVVAFAGRIVDRGVLTIDHGDGYVITLEPIESTLSPGDAVAAGAPLGDVASGGHAPGGTLHVGVRRDGAYLNPLPFFGPIPRAILYPCCADIP